MWQSFVCAMTAAVCLQAFDPFRSGKLVLYQTKYSVDWHEFEIIPYAMLGILGVSLASCVSQSLGMNVIQHVPSHPSILHRFMRPSLSKLTFCPISTTLENRACTAASSFAPTWPSRDGRKRSLGFPDP